MAGRPIQVTIMGDADQLTRTLDEASDEISAFGEHAKGLALVAGGVIAAGIGAGIASALEKEVGTDLLAAQLGASPAEAKTLGEAAGKVYSDGYGESVADANEALKGLWQQGLVPAGATADEMAHISKQAMDVATVLGDEVGPTSAAVGQMLKTGLAKNATEAFDILVKGTQEGANKSEDLLDTFNEYGVQFKGLGLDGKTAMGLLSQGLKGGARDADLVADSLKEFGLIVRAGGDDVNESYKAIGLSGTDMTKAIAAGGPAAAKALDQTLDGLRKVKDPAERSALAVKLFGTQAEDMQDSLFALDPSKAVESLGKVDGAAKTAGETMHDNAANKLSQFTRALQTGLVDLIGGRVLPILEKFTPTIAGVGAAIAATAAFVTQHKTAFSIVAGVITALLLPALIAWGVQSAISAARSVAAWVMSSVSAVVESTKQALAHAAVVAGWIASGAQAVLSAARVVAGWVLMGTQSLLQGARMAAAWLLAMGPIPIIIALVVGLVVLIVANWDTIKTKTVAAFNWIWEWVKKIFAWLKNLFLNFTGPGLIIKHWDKIVSATKTAFAWVKNTARDAINSVILFFAGLPGRIAGMGRSLLSAAKGIGRFLVDGLKSGLSKLGGFASSLAGTVTKAVKGAINSVIDLLNWAIPNKLGMGPLSINIPDNPIPKVRAMGGPAGGRVRVGERGPEEIMLPNGSTVIPNHRLGSGGGVTVNVQTNADPWQIGREVAWALRTGPA